MAALPRLSLDGREGVAESLRTLSLGALGLTIVLLPLRARLLLEARPLLPVYGDFTNLLLFWSDIALALLLALWLASLALKPRRLWLGPLLPRVAAAGLL